MQTQHVPTSIKIIYYITHIVFWLFVMAAILALGFSTAFSFGLFEKPQLHVGIPFAMNVLETGSLKLYDVQMPVEMKDLYGKVHFIDTPLLIGRVYSIFLLVILIFAGYIMWIIRKFITNVYHGIYFHTANIRLLKNIAYSFAGIWVFIVAYAIFQYFFLVKHFKFETVEFTNNIDTSPQILLAALFIWVLSHIFMQGCKLQEENNYTI